MCEQEELPHPVHLCKPLCRAQIIDITENIAIVIIALHVYLILLYCMPAAVFRDGLASFTEIRLGRVWLFVCGSFH